MASPATTAQTCDHHSCPAPAQRTLWIHSQDFYFCAHHSAEVERALTATVTVRWMATAEKHAEPLLPVSRRATPALPPQRTPQEQ